MEKRIKAYEQFIERSIKQGINHDLIDYHREVLRNFQHERGIHLAIMLFFIFLTFIITGLCFWLIAITANWMELFPILTAAILFWIMSIAYVRHYYFLENHIQKLYDVSEKLYKRLSE